MKMFYSGLISEAQDGVNTTDATIKTFLKRRINSRYELITDKLNTWTQILTRTATSGDSDGDDQQFYANPPNLREIESIVLTDSDDNPYPPLKIVDSQEEWDRLNASTIVSGIPCRYFPRGSDYGIYPTPSEDDWTITVNYTQRASPLYFENYTTGTAQVTENSQTVVLTTGVTTTLKAGFWFCLTDSNLEPRGTFYKIGAIASSANLTLETYFEETGETGATYIVGQIPEIPEEGHELLAIGAVADFYGLKVKDMDSFTKFNNMFWSGSPNVTPLQAEDDPHAGGLTGLIAAYKERDSSHVVSRISHGSDSMDLRNPTALTIPDD